MSATIPKTHLAALVAKLEPGATVEFKEISTPTAASLKPGECLVKVDYSGVCHSDYSIKNLEYPVSALAKLPLVGGHEGVGTIVAFADHSPSSTFSLGQRVGIKYVGYSCLSCDACRRGSEWLCSQQKASGLQLDGSFQQYAVAHINAIVPIPDGLDSAAACPILCAGVTVYKALKQSDTIVGDWVALPGAGGGLGHLAVQYANAMGLRVVAIDTGAEKKALCEKLGAAAWIDFKETSDIPKAVMEATGGKGVNAAIVTAASVEPYQQALGYLAAEGTLVCVGLPPSGMMQFPVLALVAKCQRIQGSLVGSRQDTVEALELAASGKVKSHYSVRPLRDLPEVYDLMEKGQLPGRVVLDMSK